MTYLPESDADRAFRLTVRAWVRDNLPAELRDLAQLLDPEPLRWWHRMLWQAGWVAPGWPAEYGGGDESIERQLIIAEELALGGAPYLLPTGLNLLGPTMMAFGTPEQKAQHLPRILNGEVFWAQGYSEPNAGSDLASLLMTAEDDGADFIVTGEKIWSSYAHFCGWMFALARTDPKAARPQSGISMLLIDLASPGIARRPIATIVGQEEFAQVSFDHVRVPKSGLLGPLHGGWKVANHVLSHERLNGAGPRNCFIALRLLYRAAQESGRLADPGFRAQLTELEIELLAFLALYRRAVAWVKAGRDLEADSSVMKIAGSELLQRLTDHLMDAAGADGVVRPAPAGPRVPANAASLFMLSRRASIYGGSSEIQRNIIAARILGFPRSN